MARKILEELYFENIKPNSRNVPRSESYVKAMILLDEVEQKLLATLKDNEHHMFKEYADAWGCVHGTDVVEKWIDGFKIGLQIGMAVYLEDDSCIDEI